MAKSDWISDGWGIFKDSFRILKRYPVIALPLFGAWIVVAAVTLAFRYLDFTLSAAFLAIFLVAYSISLACFMLLEFIEQIESGQKISYLKASYQLVTQNAIKVIPLTFVWTIIWFILIILRALTKKKGDDDDNPEPSLEDAGQTLSGLNNSPFSWWGLGLDLIEKLLRMIVFTCLPAIAWEGKGSIAAFKKGSTVVRKHPGQFFASYGLTGAAALLMALPLVPIGFLSKAEVELPGAVWIAVIIYSGIIWTIEMYLEQMTVAILYLWHLKAEEQGVHDLNQVSKPHLLDNIPELNSRQLNS